LGSTFDDLYEDEEESDDSVDDDVPSTPKRAVIKGEVVKTKGGVHFTREAEEAGEEKPVMKPGTEAGGPRRRGVWLSIDWILVMWH
jgi:hypothetical protein